MKGITRHAADTNVACLRLSLWLSREKSKGQIMVSKILLRFFLKPRAHERNKNIAETIQAYVVAGAIILGGGWTLFQFTALNQLQRAKLELENLQPKDALSVKIQVEQLGATNQPERAVHISIEFANAGDAETILDFSTPPIILSKVISDDGETRFRNTQVISFTTPHRDGRLRTAKMWYLEPKSKRTFSSVAFVPTSGVYLVQFDMPNSAKDQEEERAKAIKEGRKPNDYYTISAEKYFAVR
jgi:hypothetical protein